MSSGSYFTIYRKHTKTKVDQSVIDALKHEYYLTNKSGLFASNDDEKLKEDMPVLFNAKYSNERSMHSEVENCATFYDADGYMYDKLLEFRFGSTFSCLRNEFGMNSNLYKTSSTFISKAEAKQMLQAIEYILSEQYSKKFEDVLDNKYVELFGQGYSLFIDRFRCSKPPVYIDKNNEDGYMLSFSDPQYDAEISECDNDCLFALKRAKACLLAFLEAEECSWDNEELVLEYSVY